MKNITQKQLIILFSFSIGLPMCRKFMEEPALFQLHCCITSSQKERPKSWNWQPVILYWY